MASNRQRSKLSHKLWTRLREVGGSEIEIMGDPLGHRYQVHRHGIHVEGPQEVLEDTYDRMLALLKIECWYVEAEKHGAVEVAQECRPESPKAFIDKPHPTYPGSDESRMRITVL